MVMNLNFKYLIYLSLAPFILSSYIMGCRICLNKNGDVEKPAHILAHSNDKAQDKSKDILSKNTNSKDTKAK